MIIGMVLIVVMRIVLWVSIVVCWYCVVWMNMFWVVGRVEVIMIVSSVWFCMLIMMFVIS